MYSHSNKLDPFDILRLVAIPGEPAVFVLPTQDRPNRIVSQQRRALTLARAVIDSQSTAGKKTNDIRLAVVGGGFGGVTAALYAAQTGAQVMLFEKESEILSRFKGSDRHIDPKIADWPDEGWLEENAGLRVLDWDNQKSAGALAAHAREILRRAPAITNLEVHRGAVVNLLPGTKPGTPRRLIWSTAEGGRTDVFDAVLVATGFGEERPPNGWKRHLPSYWTTDVPLTSADRTVAIIGNGDGALMELARLLGVPINAEKKFIQDALERREREIAEVLREHEARWQFDHDTSDRAADRSADVSRVYFEAVSALRIDPARLTRLVHPDLKHPDLKHIYVFGRSADLLTPTTYAVNRLLVALLLKPVGDPSSGRYQARRLEHPVAVDYVCADAEIEAEDHGLYHLRATRPGASVPSLDAKPDWGLLKVNQVIPRLGPMPLEGEWAKLALRGNGDKIRGQLNLLEKNVPTHVLRRTGVGGSWPALISEKVEGSSMTRQRLRFGSEFYDTYIQRLAHKQMAGVLKNKPDHEQRGLFETVYVGKLRFDTLLWNTVLLPDAQILDGLFFHELSVTGWDSVEPLLRAPAASENRARVSICARAGDILSALAQFFVGTKQNPRRVFPELSAAPEAQRTTQLELRQDRAWDWDIVKDAMKGAAATLNLLARLDTLIGRFGPHWEHNFEPWKKWFLVIPSLDVFDIVKAIDDSTFAQLAKEVGTALRTQQHRTEVFAGIRKVTDEEPLQLAGEGLAKFVAWYNSSYNLGIFHRARADAGEFLWVPDHQTADAKDAVDIGSLCMTCLGMMSKESFDEKREQVRIRRDLRGRLERALSVLEPPCLTSNEHSALDEQCGGAASVAATLKRWAAPVSVEVTSTGWRYVSDAGGTKTVLSRVEFTE